MQKEHEILVLFDIDGTLVTKTKENNRSMHTEALSIEKPLKLTLELAGLSDWDCLKILSKNTIVNSNTIENLFEFFETLELNVPHYTFESLPGVTEFLEYCTFNGVRVGILTGNTFRRAQKKLVSAGLYSYFLQEFMFCCEKGESRLDIAKRAVQNSHNMNCIFIGDTKHDISVGNALNIPVIAVATGTTSSAELIKEQPALLVGNFKSNNKEIISFLRKILN